MTGAKLSVVFFGSGPVAAKSLELLAKDFDVEAVVTKPKPSGWRGEWPVLEAAQKHKLRILTANNKAELSEAMSGQRFKSRLGLVIDYGIIIPEAVFLGFELGIVNSHFSLLPQWRGADPISFAILSGQKETGVSLMIIEAGLDTGPLLAQETVRIPAQATTSSLTEQLIKTSHDLLKVALPDYAAGKIRPYPQDPSMEPTYSRKLAKEDGKLDWTKPADQLEREIRAFHEWPKSRATIAGKEVIITEASVTNVSGKPGEILRAAKKLTVACGRNGLLIEQLKPAGGREMSAAAFLAGLRN